MDFSLISKRLREKIAQISGKLSRKLDKTARIFVIEVVYGILSSQSVLLTEIGRSLDEKVKLKKIVERFCRHLGKIELWFFTRPGYFRVLFLTFPLFRETGGGGCYHFPFLDEYNGDPVR